MLEVEDLAVEFRTRDGVVRAVDGVSYHVDAGETLAILGESGSGKSVGAQAVMGLIDSPPGYVTRGSIRYRGRELLELDEGGMQRIRGRHVAMVFQDALSSLNPVFTVGDQIAEMYRVHEGASRAEARRRAVEMMDRVHIPAAERRYGDYPHQFSGGMRQRIMIAMALSLGPDVLIADEPTTALDVTVQAQIMDLLAELQRDTTMALVLITHDLGVVADVADRIAVMYAGRVVEQGAVSALYERPAHPYTLGLIESIPRMDDERDELVPIPGAPPSLMRIPPGCSFHPRCPMAQDVCAEDDPPLYAVQPGRESACHFWEEVLTSHG
ncbi:peptide ABC transporter ATP-binding protein [Knoellia aerolata DSM 18566]|uniref:Peptide ABC transporter ATP-binding protein n=1 Tax=Knoellia aerolata DSM 18566 TaxID=1385519 RepID=A0A0A0K1T8_9MICO|nr:peptide ABC transporter ATP-binding protein [Knoellia aerolata DSM 18566]